MVLPRVITALLLTPFVIAVVWYGSVPFFIFVLALTVFSLWELSMMADEGGCPAQFWLGIGGGVLVVLALYLDGAPLGPVRKAPGPLFILVVWMFASLSRELFRKDKGHSVLRIVTTATG